VSSSPRDPPPEFSSRVRRDLERQRSETRQFWRRHRGPTALTRAVRALVRQQSGGRISLASSGAAFWLVISAFPTAIAALSVYGLFVSPRRVAADLGHLANGVPGSLGSLLSVQLRHVAGTTQAHLSLGLGLSLLLALWSASSGFHNLDGAIRLAYGLAPQRYFEARGRAFVGAFAVVVILGLVAVATPLVLSRPSPLVSVLGVVGAIVGIGVGVGALYRFSIGGPVALTSLLPGVLVSVTGVAIVTVGFGAYVDVSTHYTAVYGAFAGAVVAMLAIYLAVYFVLLGAVLNVQLSGAVSSQGPPTRPSWSDRHVVRPRDGETESPSPKVE
jgi:membrane protein